jgi:hypothetical protein
MITYLWRKGAAPVVAWGIYSKGKRTGQDDGPMFVGNGKPGIVDMVHFG